MSTCPTCQTNPSDSSGFTSGFFLGLIVGGAGGYLLSTERGKEMLNNLRDGAGDKLAEIAENPQVSDKLAELEDLMQKARTSLNDGSESAREKIHQAASEVAAATKSDTKKKKHTFLKRGRALK